MSVVELPRTDLFRAAYPAVEMREAESARPTVFGHFSVFNVWTEINSRYEGHFMERFAPGSFKRTFNNKKGFIPPLLEHGQDPSVWKKPLGDVVELCEDVKGAYYEVNLYDTLYVKEILPAIVSGHYGASFRFGMVREDFVRNPGVSAWNPKGIAERTVLEANVAEFSLVLFPAYREASVGVRSLTDFYNPDAIQRALDEFNNAQEFLRESQEHIERVSTFIAERQVRGNPEDLEAQLTEEEYLNTMKTYESDSNGVGHTWAETVTQTSGTFPLTITVSTAGAGGGGVTYNHPPTAVGAPEPDPEDVETEEETEELPAAAEAPEETVRGGEPQERTREQVQERLYQRSYQVLGESIWAVHPGMLEVYLNIMAERRAGYRPTQAEIDERISQRASAEADSYDEEMAGSVAIIDVTGSIMPHGGAMSNASSRGSNVEDLEGDFNAALADGNVKSILFNIDSPGGSVDLIPEFADTIRAARGKKPIIAAVNTMAASAAYWIASACDKIYVTPSGEVGSIGVYSCHSDLSEKLAKEGVKKTFVSAGKYKVDGNPYEPLSADAEADMQKKVDTYYEMFITAVAEGRGVTSKDVDKNYGQGRMFLAEEAVSLGLADEVATLAEVLATLDSTASLPEEEESDTETPPAPADNEPEPEDDDPQAHLSPEARETTVDTSNHEEKPSWLI